MRTFIHRTRVQMLRVQIILQTTCNGRRGNNPSHVPDERNCPTGRKIVSVVHSGHAELYFGSKSAPLDENWKASANESTAAGAQFFLIAYRTALCIQYNHDDDYAH